MGTYYVLVAVFVVLGLVRPRWSSLYAAIGPAALPLVWVLWGVVEPDRSLGLSAQWYISVGAIYGVVALSSCAAGIGAGRAVRYVRRPQTD